MHKKPKNWTHHHTQRMYHLSMLAIFVFIVLVILFGILVLISPAHAGTVTQSQDVGASASVAGIAPGPATSTPTSGGGGGIYIPPIVPAPQAPYQEITILPSPAGSYEKRTLGAPGQEQFVYIITTPRANFIGQTSIGNARVILILQSAKNIIQDVVYADAGGNFVWQPPQNFADGVYSLTAVAQDPNDASSSASTTISLFVALKKNAVIPPVIIPPHAPGQIELLLLLRIPPEYKIIFPGQTFVAQLNLQTSKNYSREKFPINYKIIDAKGAVLSAGKDTIEPGRNYYKTFYTKATMKAGTYLVQAEIDQGNTTLYASDSIELQGKPVIALSQKGVVDYTAMLQLLFGLLLFFGFIVYFEYNKVVVLSRYIRKVSEEDLREPRPLTPNP